MTRAGVAVARKEGAAAAPSSPKVGQILLAARKVFMRDGYGAASMDAIAREAAVSKATLYAHFSGKEALFAAVIHERCQHLTRSLSPAELEPLALAEALRRVGRLFLDLILSPEAVALYRVVVAEAPRFKDLGRVFYESGPMHVKRSLADYLEAVTRRGLLAVPEPYLAAEQFVGMLHGHFHLMRVLGVGARPADHQIEQAIDLAVRVLTRGYAAG